MTIPAGTPLDAPVTIDLDLDNWTVDQIDLEVPAGPTGLMGFYVANNNVQWIPRQPGTWLIWDDKQQSWPLDGQPNASGWQIVGYNTGTYDHLVTVRMHVTPPTAAATSLSPPVLTFVSSGEPAQPAVTVS